MSLALYTLAIALPIQTTQTIFCSIHFIPILTLLSRTQWVALIIEQVRLITITSLWHRKSPELHAPNVFAVLFPQDSYYHLEEIPIKYPAVARGQLSHSNPRPGLVCLFTDSWYSLSRTRQRTLLQTALLLLCISSRTIPQCCVSLCCSEKVFAVPLPSNDRTHSFHYSGFQPLCYNSMTSIYE